MKNKFWVAPLIMVLIAIAFVFNAFGEPEDTVTVEALQNYVCQDNKPTGIITQNIIKLEENRPVSVNMSQVFDIYPEHSGVYGILYATGNVTVSATVSGEEMTKSGSGTLEFSFPGAMDCIVSGNGTVYAYFLPVPYYRLSTSVSLVRQKFDTSYLTATKDGHANMFIVADPHIYIYQDNIPESGTVYKFKSSLGPTPQGYSQFTPLYEGYPSLLSYVYNTPVLVQCYALSEASYATDTYTARPMYKHTGSDTYEIWSCKDLDTAGSVVDYADSVISECIHMANEQFLCQGLKVDKIMIGLLSTELQDVAANGIAFSEELYNRIGFANYIFLDVDSFNDGITNYDYYLLAHEIGHIVQHASLAYNSIDFSRWFSEGFATYFGEKVCKRLGRSYRYTAGLNEHDSAEVNKFHMNLVFGIDDYSSYYDGGTWSESVLLYPGDPYSFGSIFFRYMEAKYGEGFYKKISNAFYNQVYKGYENRFHDRVCEIDYRPDTFYALIRSGFNTDVYLDYPAYLYYEMPDMVVRDAINPDGPCADGHTLAAYEQVDATYTENGTEAYWKCKICGKLFSDAEAINEIDEPISIPKLISITTQPESVTVQAGEKITFIVEAEGENLTYQWYYQKPGESDWTKVNRNGTSATLTLTPEERHNGYSYRCTVTGSDGAVMDSNTATLIISDAKPVFSNQPESIVVEPGSKVTFRVAALGTDLKYQWYYLKPDASDWVKVSTKGTSATYSLTTAARHNGYSYRCTVTNAAGSVNSIIATLTVGSQPAITAHPESVTVVAGSKATFKVVASGDGLKYQWSYLKPGASTWTRVSSNGTSATYSLTTAARHNGYQYRCEVTNAAGSVESSVATLTIGTKPTIKTQPASVTVTAGSKANFKVVASGTGLKYQWYYLKPGASTWTKVSSNGTSATYSLTTAARHNGYSYYCKVTNDAGSVDSNVAKLTIGSKPAITTQPEDVKVKAGEKAVFEVTAKNAKSYKWYYRTNPDEEWKEVKTNGTSATYTLTTAARHNGYEYRCRVTNEAGSVYTEEVTLTVEAK